jgi:hypothetical protein
MPDGKCEVDVVVAGGDGVSVAKIKVGIGMVVIGVVVFTAWLRSNGGRVWADRQWAGVCVTKGGYQSWVVEYSYGMSLEELKPDGTVVWKNHWHWPRFRHTDLRALARRVRASNESYATHGVWPVDNVWTQAHERFVIRSNWFIRPPQ